MLGGEQVCPMDDEIPFKMCFQYGQSVQPQSTAIALCHPTSLYCFLGTLVKRLAGPVSVFGTEKRMYLPAVAVRAHCVIHRKYKLAVVCPFLNCDTVGGQLHRAIAAGTVSGCARSRSPKSCRSAIKKRRPFSFRPLPHA